MKQNDLSFQYTFKKINENINLKCKVVFSAIDKNRAYYASNNMIISYDVSTSFIVERYRVSNLKVRNFIIIDKYIFVIDNGNEFIKYDLEKKQIEKSLNLCSPGNIPKDGKISFFKYSKYLNSFLFLSDNLELIQVDFELSEDYLNIKKLDELMEENFKKRLEKYTSNNKIRFMDVDENGKTLIFSINKNACVVNLLNSKISIIDFQKPISAGLFLDDSKFVLGDIAGKIHFISKFHETKVT